MSNEQSDALPPGTELRIARSTKQLDALASMYQEGLGLKLLGSFEDHAGHSGAMLGASGAWVITSNLPVRQVQRLARRRMTTICSFFTCLIATSGTTDVKA